MIRFEPWQAAFRAQQVLDGPAYYPLHQRFGRLKAGGKRQAPVSSFAVTSDSCKSEAFRV
jgi:hypothetical protein